MAEDRAREIMKELEEDLRRHEASARKLLSEVPMDADEINVRQHVRLQSKASTYGHAAELVADASTRLPTPLDSFRLFEEVLFGLQKVLDDEHGLMGAAFSIQDEKLVVTVRPHPYPIEVDLQEIRRSGPSTAFDYAVALWRERRS